MQIEGTEGPIIITEGAMGSTDEAEVTVPILTEDNLRQVLQKPTLANTLKDVLKIVEGKFDLTRWYVFHIVGLASALASTQMLSTGLPSTRIKKNTTGMASSTMTPYTPLKELMNTVKTADAKAISRLSGIA